MSKELRYKFFYIENCNMCGSSLDTHKILGRRLNLSQGKNPKRKIGIATTVCQCRNCKLIYSNPQPIPFDIQDHYSIPPESYLKNESFTISENYFKNETETAKKLLEFKEGMRFLDIGAGLGKAMLTLEKHGFDVYGLEPSKPFYEKAISHMGVNPEKLKYGMVEDIDYPENHFDFISFGAVLEHLYNPAYCIEKAMQWLKPNGIIHIEVPSSRWLISKIINAYYHLRGTDYVVNISPMHAPFHLHEFDLASFVKHGEKAGYTVALHEYYVCETYMPRILDIFLKPYMRWTKKGMQLCVWLRKK